MTKTSTWLELVDAMLPAFILGWLISDLHELYFIYFGKDVLNSVISIVLIIVTLFLASKRVPQLNYALPISLILVIITPHVINYMHNFPSYVTGFYYFTIVLLTLLVSAQKSKSLKLTSVWSIILISIIGTGLNKLIQPNNFIDYLIMASVITHVFYVFAHMKEKSNKRIALASFFIIPLLAFSIPTTTIHLSQKKYYDPVVFSETTPFQRIDITKWKGNLWYYSNEINLFSSVDHWLYYEPMVHPAMGISISKDKVLIIGGENGLAAQEILKYSDTNQIDIIPLDTTLIRIASANPLFTKVNKGSLTSDRVTIKSSDIFHELNHSNQKYDIIIADLPDPKDIITNQYYTKEFYQYCSILLTPKGVLVTQSGSPYFATQAFQCIDNTLQSVGFQTRQIHNQILTMGEWGWTIASMHNYPLDSLLRKQTFDQIETQWINSEAMLMMLSFGKQTSIEKNTAINMISQPTLYKYYNDGNYQ